MLKKVVTCILIALCIVSVGFFSNEAYATEIDASKYEVLNPTKASFSITDKVFLINGKAPTGTDVTIEVYGTTDLTKKSFNLDRLPEEDDYIEILSETVTAGNMGFFQKQIDLVMGINKIVVNFDVEGIEAQEYIIFVYDKSITENSIINSNDNRFSGLTQTRK